MESHHGYIVEIETTCSHSYYSKKQWGEWESAYTNRFGSIRRLDDHQDNVLPDVTSQLDLKRGDPVYVVWAEWSTGDSFGHSENSESEAFAVFADSYSAEQFSKYLQEYTVDEKERWGEPWTVYYEAPDGQKIHHSKILPWDGFFESLTEVHIDAAVMR